MYPNPYASQWQSSGGGDDGQQPKSSWKGKHQGGVGNYFSITINGVVYVGLALEVVESAGGEYIRLRFLGNHTRDILRNRLELTSSTTMTAPPEVEAIPNALQEPEEPEEPYYPGISGHAGGRPYLN